MCASFRRHETASDGGKGDGPQSAGAGARRATAGVDVELRRQLWAYVEELNRLGVTVVLTTHYLEEAEALCDTIAIINRGQVIACEPTRQLVGRMDARTVVVTPGKPADRAPEPRAFRGAPETDGRSGGELQVRHRECGAGTGGGPRGGGADQGYPDRGPGPGGRVCRPHEPDGGVRSAAENGDEDRGRGDARL